MLMTKKFYITTAIDYVNAEPHIGHAYQKIIADVLERWHKLEGEKVFFLTGTDEHGQKIVKSAEQAGLKPKEFVDKMAKKFKQAWDGLEVEYDRFIRTTDKDHEEFVKEFVKKIQKDIYKGSYEGLYCVGCERFYTEKDIENGCCPIHKTKVEKIKEETYYFRLSKYQKQLLKLYETADFVLPKERRNEIKARVSEGLQDLSITRTSFKWGIEYPFDKKHVIYVWFDALLNYLSGAGKKQEFWPADLHILGKDNGWFHAVIWPAMLLSAGYEVPKTVFIHGFLTFNGQKISKSLGNVISPNYLVEKYGAGSVRYFVCRNFVFGEDGDFSEKVLADRHNNELADKLGNLVSRVSALAEKYGIENSKRKILPLENKWKKLIKEGKIKNIDEILTNNVDNKIYTITKKDEEGSEGLLLDKYFSPRNNIEIIQLLVKRQFENYEFDKALNTIFAFIDLCNEYVQNKKPWETHDKKILYELADSIKAIAILLWPFVPSTSEKIAKVFGFEIKLGNISKSLAVKKIKKSEILFGKVANK